MMKITVDRKKCEGFAKCVEVAPRVFQLDQTMISKVTDPTGDTDQKIIFAAKVCPTKAITVEDETGKKIFPSESDSSTST
jgi:ferredoxin